MLSWRIFFRKFLSKNVLAIFMNVLLHDISVYRLQISRADLITIILLRPSPDVHALLRRLPHGVSLLYAEGLHKPAQYYYNRYDSSAVQRSGDRTLEIKMLHSARDARKGKRKLGNVKRLAKDLSLGAGATVDSQFAKRTHSCMLESGPLPRSSFGPARGRGAPLTLLRDCGAAGARACRTSRPCVDDVLRNYCLNDRAHDAFLRTTEVPPDMTGSGSG